LSLSFPNPSRNYDPDKRCVRFSGYDTVFEVVIELGVDAMEYLSPAVGDNENSVLVAFDLHRDRIERVAAKFYSGRRRDVVRLSRANF
jgi:hypothetical protein